MRRKKIKKVITGIIKEMFSSKVKESTKFVDDLEFGSLETIELTMEIEDALDINIPDTDVLKIETVKELIDYVDSI